MSDQIVVIGGGVMGSALAYWLTRLDPNAPVTVVERDPTYAYASSALSAASIRQQFSTPINVRISQASIAFLRNPARMTPFPLTIDPTGFWIRPEGGTFIAGFAPEDEGDDLPLQPDYDAFESRYGPRSPIAFLRSKPPGSNGRGRATLR